jgi:2-dehydropantoate 2-reductase
MKIAVVGCGAIGSFYGARLCQGGHETHFLLRSDYEVVRRDGVRIKSVDGDFEVRPLCANAPEQIGVADLVLIGLKTTANDQLRKLLSPLVGPETLVVTLQNGLGNEEKLAEVLGPENILCGLCFVCLNRVSPGVIHHTAHGLVVLGEFGRVAGERTHRLVESFKAARIPCRLTDDMASAHWEKLVWNIPFNGLGVAAAAGYEALVPGAPMPDVRPHSKRSTWPTDVLLADARWTDLLRELMVEVIAAARAQGHPLEMRLADENIERTRVMGSYRASTLLDFEKGLPLELESLFKEPLRRAQSGGISMPRLKQMCAVLEWLTAD